MGQFHPTARKEVGIQGKRLHQRGLELRVAHVLINLSFQKPSLGILWAFVDGFVQMRHRQIVRQKPVRFQGLCKGFLGLFAGFGRLRNGHIARG